MVAFARKSEVITGLIRWTLKSLATATWQRRAVVRGQLVVPCRDSWTGWTACAAEPAPGSGLERTG